MHGMDKRLHDYVWMHSYMIMYGSIVQIHGYMIKYGCTIRTHGYITMHATTTRDLNANFNSSLILYLMERS